jgi:hypothetical protein
VKTINYPTLEELERLIGDKEYSVVSGNARGREISVVIPWARYYGTRRYKILWRATRIFLRTLWREVIETE